MACIKFEESGLLYVSGELSENEARDYEAHLKECDECRLETEAYTKERAELYTADILGESPSPAVDAEILRVCSNPKTNTRPPVVLMPMMMFIKKYAPVPLFLMLVMVAVGGYVKYHSMNAESMRASLTTDSASVAVNEPADNATPDDGQELALSDSTADSNRIAPRKMGNIDREGVITVKGGGGQR